MKNNRILLALLAIVMAFGACKKDKPAVPSLESKLLGKWTWTKFEDIHIPADPADVTVDPMPQNASIEFLAEAIQNNCLYNEQGQGATPYHWTKIDNNSFTISSYGNVVFTLTTATASSLIFSNELTSPNGVKHVIRFTLTKP